MTRVIMKYLTMNQLKGVLELINCMTLKATLKYMITLKTIAVVFKASLRQAIRLMMIIGIMKETLKPAALPEIT